VVVVVMAVCDVVEWGSRGMVKARGEGTVRVWVWGGGGRAHLDTVLLDAGV
jgi:hypothetical protein